MFTISKTIRVTEDTHSKIESIMLSYGYKTFGDAVTFAVNKLFIEEEEKEEEIVKIQRDKRDIEEIEFLRDLALAQAKSTVTVQVSGGGGSFQQPTQQVTPQKTKKKELTEEEIEELRNKVRKDMDGTIQELDTIYENGSLAPSTVLEICQPEHKNSDIESLEEYQKRIDHRLKDARRGKLKGEKVVLDKQINESLNDTKEGLEHPSGLAPPP